MTLVKSFVYLYFFLGRFAFAAPQLNELKLPDTNDTISYYSFSNRGEAALAVGDSGKIYLFDLRKSKFVKVLGTRNEMRWTPYFRVEQDYLDDRLKTFLGDNLV